MCTGTVPLLYRFRFIGKENTIHFFHPLTGVTGKGAIDFQRLITTQRNFSLKDESPQLNRA